MIMFIFSFICLYVDSEKISMFNAELYFFFSFNIYNAVRLMFYAKLWVFKVNSFISMKMLMCLMQYVCIFYLYVRLAAIGLECLMLDCFFNFN